MYPNRFRIVEVDPADKVGIVISVPVMHVDGSPTPPVDLAMVDLDVLAGVYSNAICVICPHRREWVVTLPTVQPDTADPYVIAGVNLTVAPLAANCQQLDRK
jgi:hypothetical protein